MRVTSFASVALNGAQTGTNNLVLDGLNAEPDEKRGSIDRTTGNFVANIRLGLTNAHYHTNPPILTAQAVGHIDFDTEDAQVLFRLSEWVPAVE